MMMMMSEARSSETSSLDWGDAWTTYSSPTREDIRDGMASGSQDIDDLASGSNPGSVAALKGRFGMGPDVLVIQGTEYKASISEDLDEYLEGNLVESSASECSWVKCATAFKAQDNDEMSLSPGDILRLIDDDDDGWSFGEKASDGQEGFFPSTFCEPAPGYI